MGLRVKRWGDDRHRTDLRPGCGPFEAAPTLALAVASPTVSCAFGDDLLAEIDGLLHDHDVLIGFWQAGGE
jgi:hypothetical protein